MTLLAVEGLSVRYGQLTALRDASLMLDEGETLFVTGPNGAGKSTLMKAIAGVVRPAAGCIRLGGRDITGEAPETIARLGFSMVPEGRQVFGELTVDENLRLGAGMRGDRAGAARDLESVFESFPMLKERRDGAAGLLSGGQQQMLVIARALMTRPRLVAIDEPSLGLAPLVIDQVYELLLRLRAERRLTLLVVEQSSTRATMTGGRMMLLRSGRVVLEGDARELNASGAVERAYFGYSDAEEPA